MSATAAPIPSPAAADGLVIAPSATQLHAVMGPSGLPGPPSPPTTHESPQTHASQLKEDAGRSTV